MKVFRSNKIFISLLLSRYIIKASTASLRTKQRINKPQKIQLPPNHLSEDRFICTLFSVLHDALPEYSEIEPNLECVTNDNISMTVININDSINLDAFQSGKTKISVLRSALSQHDVIDMMEALPITIPENKRAVSSTQRLNFAVIRVSDDHGHSPDMTTTQLAEKIFGTSDDSLSLATGYKKCSGNKVNINPAIGDTFSNGIMNLTIPQNIDGMDRRDVQDYVTLELSKNGFDPSEYTNVMYFFPEGVKMGSSGGYAVLNGRLSVFSNRYASKLYLLMHEIGHNFGHHHSGNHTGPYGDTTGMMGRQIVQDDGPHACFNAAKSWWFGWYSDRHTEVTPTSESRILKMLSIDDYLNDQSSLRDQYTIARIVGTNEIDLFVMYNRAEGINSQVLGHRDHVTIVSQSGESQPSLLEAGLSLDDSDETLPSRWSKSNWNGSGKTLVIQLCERVTGKPDYAKVLVYLEGVNDLSCENDCPKGMSKFEVEIMTDSWGDETSWWLRARNNRGFFREKNFQDKKLPSNRITKKDLCIDNSKCYKFKIQDQGRNGICCDYGEGWYHLKINGNTLAQSKFKNSRKEVTKFGACSREI